MAGPVSVGAVLVLENFDVAREFPGVRDSKKLSEDKRENIYASLRARAKRGDVRFCVRFSSHLYIDEFGITRAVRRAVWNGVRYLAPEPEGVRVLLDGLLQAPREYEQETIIHGDDIVPLISLASIAAKVERDRLMKRLAKRFPQYGFERHKGYPTRAHYAALQDFGLCAMHRRRYCGGFSGVL